MRCTNGEAAWKDTHTYIAVVNEIGQCATVAKRAVELQQLAGIEARPSSFVLLIGSTVCGCCLAGTHVGQQRALGGCAANTAESDLWGVRSSPPVIQWQVESVDFCAGLIHHIACP